MIVVLVVRRMMGQRGVGGGGGGVGVGDDGGGGGGGGAGVADERTCSLLLSTFGSGSLLMLPCSSLSLPGHSRSDHLRHHVYTAAVAFASSD
ncbi:hypothetical protein KPH14_005867 [Odynerus spinipes]|uniref:Uncharacterized protein n=1 Tax=Odynerus spinipes TaxID=1348599 RepID=A0AAD9VKH4_9HYME|nr:hypothetical protein KPH14_005867 [Odynerus spinipes]